MEFLADGRFDVGEGVVKNVADAVLDQITKFFDRVKFRAIGRQ